ncbi:MAG: Crp/Fnr family transcriptional regulator [Bacteroidales bacterium]|nr:Crp/Fnr family transcriptional regulator [Bacteroidales bacterium]
MSDICCSNCTLRSCAIYTLSSNELKDMESDTCQAGYSKGEIIIKQGTPLNSVIYLRSGYVKEFMWHESVADQVIQLIKPRSYIGLKGICTNSSTVFSYQAITNVEICFIEKEVFSRIINGNGSFAREILIALSRESISNHKRFLNLNQKQIFGKVAGLIIYLSEEVYESTFFELHLKRADLAQMIASTRESVTRALKWFQNEGIIQMKKNTLSIEQMERLSEIAKRG